MRAELQSFRQAQEELQRQIERQMKLLEFQSDESEATIKSLLKLLAVKENFNAEAFQITKQSAVESQKILSNQIYSQTMMHNLINDLLDLAKLENNSFSFSQEYFNLGSTIYEAFQILVNSANENSIELRAEIDQESDLDMI